MPATLADTTLTHPPTQVNSMIGPPSVLRLAWLLQHHILKSFRRRIKKSSHGSKSHGSQEGMTDIVQMEELEEAERQAAKPAWKTKAFWHTAISILISVVLLVVGTVLGAKHYQKQVCMSPGCSKGQMGVGCGQTNIALQLVGPYMWHGCC